MRYGQEGEWGDGGVGEGSTRYMKVGVKCTVVTSGAFKTIKSRSYISY